ncbi:MAG: CDP-alcohol phosphatidyltransferase family protein [Rhodospirillales bacterium]|nr:CDP-alcohol phosphatidyltransferase family protein [Rhodospirillales bacterium]
MSHNTWIHRGVRVLIKPLARTPITPNQLTAARLVSGIAAATAFAVGDPAWADIGGIVFMVSFVLDRADGELARTTGRMSVPGHRFDLISDALCNMLILMGVGIGLRHGPFGDWAILMGIVAGISVVLILWLVVRVESREGARAAELPSVGGFDVDDSVLLIPVAMWVGYETPLLVASTVVSPVVAAFFVWRYWWVARRA